MVFCPLTAHWWVFSYTYYDDGRVDVYECQSCNAIQSNKFTVTSTEGVTITYDKAPDAISFDFKK